MTCCNCNRPIQPGAAFSGSFRNPFCAAHICTNAFLKASRHLLDPGTIEGGQVHFVGGEQNQLGSGCGVGV